MMNLKKPKFWDYKKPNFLSYLLYPFSLIVELYNLLNTKNNNDKFKIKTICVGNIYVGGTGKTSLCIKINEILSKKNLKSCFIKKYYKNQEDEQKILANKNKVFLSSNRLESIKNAEYNKFDIAILDDGIQDKSIEYDLSIVCFNNLNWIGNGMTIPSCPLRESINNLKKYKHIFINGNLENIDNLKNQLLKINPKIEIHIGKYVIKNLDDFNLKENFLVFSGIGNHKTFISMLQNYNFKVIEELEFPDHYKYNYEDINKILSKAKDLNCTILTTEKDYIRLESLISDKIKFIKSDLQIVDEDKFNNLILNI